MKRSEHPRRRLGVLLMVSLLTVTAVPVGIVVAEPASNSGGLERTMDALSEALQRLEAELAALEGSRAERLEEKIEGVIEAVERLLEILDNPREQLDEAARKARLLQIDLQLHRLLYVLEEIVESTVTIDQRPDAEGAIEDFREKLDGWIVYASVGMSPEEYEQLEGIVYRTAHVLGQRVADLAKKAQPKTSLPGLARLVERLEDLLFRLDGFILQHNPRRG